MMLFYNFPEIKAKTKKVVGVKVVPFGVLYSCVKFRRLKMGDPVYMGDLHRVPETKNTRPTRLKPEIGSTRSGSGLKKIFFPGSGRVSGIKNFFRVGFGLKILLWYIF